MTVRKAAGKVRSEVRREQIVHAALRITGAKGVSNLTTAAIAKEVGVSEANLYRHFRSKDDIYSEMVSRVREMIKDNLDKAVAGSDTPIAVLKSFFRLQMKLMEENSGITRFMFSEELHSHHDVRAKILETMYSVSNTLASHIREGQKTGLVRKDIDAVTTVLMFVAVLQGLAFRWSLGGFAFSLGTEGMKAWRLFEKIISVSGTGKEQA